MYILIALLSILIICVILAFILRETRYSEDYCSVLLTISFFSLLISVFMGLNIWCNNLDVDINRRIFKHNTLKQQYKSIRSNPANTIERAAIAKDIIDYNMKLAEEKYDNTTQWDWWIPDAIAKLDYIK